MRGFAPASEEIMDALLFPVFLSRNKLLFIFSRLITEQANPLTISSSAKGQWVNCTQIVPTRLDGNIRWLEPVVSSGNHHDYNDGEGEAAQD